MTCFRPDHIHELPFPALKSVEKSPFYPCCKCELCESSHTFTKSHVWYWFYMNSSIRFNCIDLQYISFGKKTETAQLATHSQQLAWVPLCFPDVWSSPVLSQSCIGRWPYFHDFRGVWEVTPHQLWLIHHDHDHDHHTSTSWSSLCPTTWSWYYK